MFFPISGLGIRLIWSVIIIRSPTEKEVLMPPEAFDTNRYSIPSSFMTRTGKVTCVMGYPS